MDHRKHEQRVERLCVCLPKRGQRLRQQTGAKNSHIEHCHLFVAAVGVIEQYPLGAGVTQHSKAKCDERHCKPGEVKSLFVIHQPAGDNE